MLVLVLIILPENVELSQNQPDLCDHWQFLGWKRVVIVIEDNPDNVIKTLMKRCSLKNVSLQTNKVDVLNRTLQEVNVLSRKSQEYDKLVGLAPIAIIMKNQMHFDLISILMKLQFRADRLMVIGVRHICNR